MFRKIKFESKIEFTAYRDRDNSFTLSVAVIDLKSEDNLSYSEMNQYDNIISEFTYDKESVTGINWDELDEEISYEADAEIIISYHRYETWDETESEIDVEIDILSYKKACTIGDDCTLASNSSLLRVFQSSENEFGESFTIREISHDKVFISVRHQCLYYKRIVSSSVLRKALVDLFFLTEPGKIKNLIFPNKKD